MSIRFPPECTPSGEGEIKASLFANPAHFMLNRAPRIVSFATDKSLRDFPIPANLPTPPNPPLNPLSQPLHHPMNRLSLSSIGLLSYLALSSNASAQAATNIVISQYYEGTSFNKFIELWNPTAAPIPLAGLKLTHWNNASRENWKTDGSTPTYVYDLGNVSPGITLAPGEFLLLAHPSAALPAYAVANADAKPATSGNTAIMQFNGDDSIVLYSSDTYTAANILDAISFTGNNGQDKTFYRLNSEKGWSIDIGSQVIDFSSVWASDKTLADVASATASDPWYLAFQADTLPPVLDSFTIAADATSTVTPGVVLTYTTSGGNPLEFQVADNADFTGAAWQPYASSARTLLTGTPGTKTLYLRVRNASGTSTVLSDSIDLIEFAPTSKIRFTQYYEGSSNSKFLEITNTGDTEVDLAGWTLMRWTNQNAEDYKFTGAGTGAPSQAIPLTGLIVPATSTPILPPGGTIVLANNTTSNPPPGGTAAALTTGNISHNGNDSYGLYSGPVDPANLVDAIGFTEVGYEGENKSFVRLATTPGFSFTAGSNLTSFPTIWSEVPLADVDAAFPGQNNHLGTYPGGGPVGYDAWALTAFPGSTDPAITGFSADPDGDGVANGVEYYTSGDPLVGSAAIQSLTGLPGQLTATYRRARLAPGVTAAWQWSTDLTSWNESGSAAGDTAVFFGTPQIVDGNNPAWELLAVTAEISGNPPIVYIRLKVTRP